MRAFVLGLAGGVWLLQRQAELPGALLLILAGAMFAAMARAGRRSIFLRIAAGVACGFLWAALFAHHRLAEALPAEWENRDIAVTGVIAGLPQPVERGVRFLFEVEPSGAAPVPQRVLLTWYNGLSPEAVRELAPVRAGERWRFKVRLRRPQGLANPHGFDYEAWLLERGIRATGYVRPGGADRVDALVARPAYLLERLRERIREKFWDALPEGRHAGILIALAIGDQNAIEPPEWRVFARTGVSHLMSISGLHVTMVSGLLAWLASFAWRRVPALSLICPAQKVAALAGFLGALLYCLVSGFAVPAQRTLYMVGVVALALWTQRAGSPSRVLALALAVVLALDPWAVLAPGFWLSFAAVALIFYVGSASVESRGRLAQWGIVQAAVTVGLAPFLLVLFGQLSLVSPVANAVAIPLVSLAVTPLALAGAILPVEFPLVAAHVLMDAMMPLLERLSALDAALWEQPAPPAWAVPLALTGAAWLLAPRGVPSRALGAVLFLPLVSVAPATPGEGGLWLTALDVGQGTSVLVRTRNHALLYDAGPAWGAHSDAGSRVVVPYLRGEGITRLDMLVVSHEDSDHSGGARSVLEAVRTDRLLSSLPPDHELQALAPYRLPCLAGQSWRWDGVRFTMLHPTGAHYANPWASLNERSCVLKIESDAGSALLTGDVGSATEMELLREKAGRLEAQVLLVPHHGSGRSSSEKFIDAVSPAYALVSAGRSNRFGHPRPEVLARYGSAGSRVERTDEGGAITARAGTPWAVSAHRVDGRRYWQGR